MFGSQDAYYDLVGRRSASSVVLTTRSGNADAPDIVIRIQAQPPVPHGYVPLPAPGDPVIVRNGADGAVSPGVSELATFELTGTYFVTQIMTYHYGAQIPPGTIALEHEDGTTYGPWPAARAVGQGNVPNAYWWNRPNVALKPGRYMVADSDSQSWSHEAATRGSGVFMIWGRPMQRDKK